MVLNSVNDCITLAIYFTLTKFPEEVKDFNRNKFSIFEIADMVANELANKHSDLFVKPYLEQLVDVKDFNIGDRNVFYLKE